jgi:hypothetical protein
MTWMEVPGDRLKEPEITFQDFIKSLKNARPSVSNEDITRHIKFTEEFGQEVLYYKFKCAHILLGIIVNRMYIG